AGLLRLDLRHGLGTGAGCQGGRRRRRLATAGPHVRPRRPRLSTEHPFAHPIRKNHTMSVTHPAGFRAGGVAAGLKSSGGLDLALVVNDDPSSASASVFTANRCIANPVIWSKEVVKDGVVRAVVLNSGGANCYTGPDGFQNTHP